MPAVTLVPALLGPGRSTLRRAGGRATAPLRAVCACAQRPAVATIAGALAPSLRRYRIWAAAATAPRSLPSDPEWIISALGAVPGGAASTSASSSDMVTIVTHRRAGAEWSDGL